MYGNIAAKLSPHQAEMLLGHVDGPRPVVLAGSNGRTMRVLVEIGLLVYCTAGGRHLPRSHRFPRFTIPTEDGRAVLSRLLATQADGLVALGCADPDAPPLTIVPDQEGGIRDDEPVLDESRGIRDVATLP